MEIQWHLCWDCCCGSAQSGLWCHDWGGHVSNSYEAVRAASSFVHIVTPLRGVLINPETAALAVLLFYKSLNQSTATISVKALELVHIRWSWNHDPSALWPSLPVSRLIRGLRIFGRALFQATNSGSTRLSSLITPKIVVCSLWDC